MAEFEQLVANLATKDDMRGLSDKIDGVETRLTKRLDSVNTRLEALCKYAEKTDRDLTHLVAGGKLPE